MKEKGLGRLPEAFNKYNSFIEEELKALFKQRDLYLYDMMQYHMGWKDSQGGGNCSQRQLKRR